MALQSVFVRAQHALLVTGKLKKQLQMVLILHLYYPELLIPLQRMVLTHSHGRLLQIMENGNFMKMMKK